MHINQKGLLQLKEFDENLPVFMMNYLNYKEINDKIYNLL